MNFAFYRRLFYYTAARALQLARDEFMRYLACSSGGGTALSPEELARCVPRMHSHSLISFLGSRVCVRGGVLCLQENKMPPRQALHTKMRRWRRGPFSFSLSLDDALPAMGIGRGVRGNKKEARAGDQGVTYAATFCTLIAHLKFHFSCCDFA